MTSKITHLKIEPSLISTGNAELVESSVTDAINNALAKVISKFQIYLKQYIITLLKEPEMLRNMLKDMTG